MQCYEYQLMLSHVYEVIALTQPGFKYDAQVLSDILADLDVNNLTELTQVAPKVIRMQALAYMEGYELAA